jgi:raffinose/stachyose/melibiose transport system substrate-binding protein
MKTALKWVLCLLLILAAGTAAFAQKKTTLVYLSKWNQDEVTAKIIDAAIEGWLKDNPSVNVEREWAGRGVNAKLMAMIQAGTPPDFYDEDPKVIEESIGKAGQALDLLPYMKKVKAYQSDKMVIDTFSKGFFNMITFRGQVNCLPIQQYLTSFWYDKTLWKQLGLAKTPDTWAQFLDACAKIKGQNLAPIVMDGGVNFYNMYYFSHLADRYEGMNALLAAIYDKDGSDWDKPGFLKAQKAVKELRDKGYFIKGFEGYQFPAGQIDWAQRKGVFLLIHSYMPIEVKDAKPDDFSFGSFPFPSVPGGKGDQYQLTSVFGGVGILKATKNPDLAFDLLKRMVSKEIQQRFAEEALNVPVIMDVPLPDIFSDLAAIMKKQTGTFTDYSGGPGQFEPEYAQKIMYPLNQDVLFGKLSPEDFVKQVKAKSIEYWKGKK